MDRRVGEEVVTHDEVKALYLAYRAKAKEISIIGPILPTQISIQEYANVQMTEKGAWVEAHVWVPKEKL